MRFLNVLLLVVFASSPELFAKDANKKGSGGTRERIIKREASSKAGSKTKIDFDDADISGGRKNPYGSMLTNTKSNKNFDMVPIRTDWRPEMLQSASSLDAGRVR